jgi:hypothetical protein
MQKARDRPESIAGFAVEVSGERSGERSDHAKRFWLSSCLSVVLDSRVAIQKQNAVTNTPMTLRTKISISVSFAENGTSDEEYNAPKKERSDLGKVVPEVRCGGPAEHHRHGADCRGSAERVGPTAVGLTLF